MLLSSVWSKRFCLWRHWMHFFSNSVLPFQKILLHWIRNSLVVSQSANPGWTFHIQYCVGKLLRLLFPTRNMKPSLPKSFISTCLMSCCISFTCNFPFPPPDSFWPYFVPSGWCSIHWNRQSVFWAFPPSETRKKYKIRSIFETMIRFFRIYSKFPLIYSGKLRNEISSLPDSDESIVQSWRDKNFPSFGNGFVHKFPRY